MIPVFYHTARGDLLPYARYLRIQNFLRKKRKELILFCEHSPAITAGIQTRKESYLTDPALLKDFGIDFMPTGRGGDLTAHEPGQCIIYPHIDLKKRNIKISAYFQLILKVTQASLLEVWKIETRTGKDFPGLYLDNGEKIVSIGIMVKTFFSSFGAAVNVSNSGETFRHILPCGQDQKVASICEHGGKAEKLSEFEKLWYDKFSRAITGP